MRNTYINTILDAAAVDNNLFIITGDAGLGVFDEFKEKHREQYINLGVAEQNAASFSAGMALAGRKVFYYNIIPFVLYRCYEQVRNDICYQKLPVTLVGIGSGVTYAPQGMTHYSVEDLGLAQTLPNLTVFSPIDPIEASLAAGFSIQSDMPVYVRLAKRGEPDIHKSKDFDITEPQLLRQGEDTAIITHGSAAIEAVKASDLLNKENIYPAVFSLAKLQPLSGKALASLLSNYNSIITVEEHYTNCGMAAMMRNDYYFRHAAERITALGFPPAFIHNINTTASLRDIYGFDAAKIAEKVKMLMEERRR